jgi:phage-related holin
MNIKIIMILITLMAIDYFTGTDTSELVYCWQFDYTPKCEAS